MGKSKKNKVPPDDQSLWGRGDSKVARKRRRLREAGLALDRLDRPKDPAIQEPLNYGTPAPRRTVLAELPSALNAEPQPAVDKPATKTHKTPIIDLKRNKTSGISTGPGTDFSRSKWRPVADYTLGGAREKIQSKTQVIDLTSPATSPGRSNDRPKSQDKVDPWLHTMCPPSYDSDIRSALTIAKPTFSFGQANGVPANLGEASHRRKEQARDAGISKLVFSFGQPDQQAIGFDVAAKGVVGPTAKITFGQIQQNQQKGRDQAVIQNKPTFSSGQPAVTASNYPTQRTITFGQPQKPAPGFDRIAWVRQDPETLANWTPRRGKSLEDLYKEHPEKRLRSIEPDTLEIIAKTVQQIANEAANHWLEVSCPDTRWSDSIVSVEGLYNFDASELDYTILDRAPSLQAVKNRVTSLILSSRAMMRDAKNMKLLVLGRVMDQSVAVCHFVKDDKRRALLEKAKEKIEWLPVGLDCKKLDIHRRATRKLEQYRIQTRIDAAKTGPLKQGNLDTKCEGQILDCALVEFQEHRLEYVVEIFNTLRQLLGATA